MLLVIEKSSIQAFLVSEEKGMQQKKELHVAVSSSVGILLGRIQHHMQANRTRGGDGAATYKTLLVVQGKPSSVLLTKGKGNHFQPKRTTKSSRTND